MLTHNLVKFSSGLTAIASLFLTGCNTEGLWQSDRQIRNAPVDSRTTYLQGDPAPIDLDITEQEEVDLVEALVHHRREYHRSLHRLREFYQRRGRAEKLAWADFELKGVRNTRAFSYLLEAEVPQDNLRPVARIPEADRIYERGTSLMREGGHGVPALYRRDKMLRSADAFRELIVRFPNSDKIDDAAFQLGEIHKEYLPNQEMIAVKWYERAWTWDPQTPHPARFQAAVVSDYRLHDRDRALELYQAVVNNETDSTSNVRFAMRRIHELSLDTQSQALSRGRQ